MIPIVSTILTPVLFLTGMFGITPEKYNQNLGVAIPTTIALFETSLANSITSTESSMTLVYALTKDGTQLATSTYAFIIDEGSASEEFVVATCAQTSCTGMTRGISAINGSSSVTVLKKAHRRGASVKITTAPIVINLARILNGDETIPNALKYDNHPCSVSSASTTICDKDFITAQVNQGAATATALIAGISKLSVASVDANNPIVVGDNDTRVPTQNENDALVGTSGTAPSVSNKYVDNADTTGTGTINRSSVGRFTFGGTGADGALSISSGTTTLDVGGAAVFVKNYTSISITGTGSLAFSNPHASGTVIILKSQGNVTITSSSALAISTIGMGASASTSGVVGIGDTLNHSTGLAFVTTSKYTLSTDNLYLTKNIVIGSGSGGSGALGGRGGGGLYIECNGAWNFTTGTITTNGTTAVAAALGGGSGGGSAGQFLVLYNTLTANTGTIVTTGGAGGKGGNDGFTGYAGGAGGTGGGGGGGGASGQNGGDNGNNGAGSMTAGGAGGGNLSVGVAGTNGIGYLITPNTEF